MKRFISLLLVLVLELGLMAGCGGDSNEGESVSNGSAVNVTGGAFSTEKVEFVKDNAAVYRLVRNDNSEATITAAQYLFKQMKDKLGANFRNVSDSEDGSDIYEILIGDVNRPEVKIAKDYLESAVGGRYNDYIIATVGKKIVIYVENEENLQKVCQEFLDLYVKPEGVEGGILLTKGSEGNFANYTINGVDVGKFDFVRPHYNSSYLTEVEMNDLSATVLEKTGYKMQITHDTVTASSPAKYEIIVGNTTREGVETISNYDAYNIKIAGEKVYINGGSAHATAIAVSEFGKMLEKGDVTDANSVTSASYEQTMSSYDKTNEYYKTWGDDFDGDTLDTTKWWQCDETYSQAAGLNGKTSVRSSQPGDVFLTDGKFYICAREDDKYYYGGMIRSEGRMSYKYGYLEMSAIIPDGDGFWVALWTQSTDATSFLDPSQPCVSKPEIDIVECFGNSAYYEATGHLWPTSYGKNTYGYEHTTIDKPIEGVSSKYSADTGKILGDGFHTYGYLWDINSIAFTCDGNLFIRHDTTTTEFDKETFNHSQYLIFSMALGFANSPLAKITDDPKEWTETNKLVADWINIYQKDDGLHTIKITGK